MKRAQRHAVGTVRWDRRRGTWNYLYYDQGKRRSRLIGNKQQYPTKASAWRAVPAPTAKPQTPGNTAPTVSELIANYRSEKIPKRYSTRRSYECWLRNHVIPKWGSSQITDLRARPVELWLNSLTLTSKSKTHLRGLLRILLDYAMWRGDMPTERNQMELVTVPGASKRCRVPRSLTVEEFRAFVQQLQEPFHTMAMVCVCFGLRISECLALKWSDVDWLDGRLSVQRGIVRQRVADTKTIYSQRAMTIDAEMLEVLKQWKQASEFPAPEDWMFASPTKLGRQPWCSDQVWRHFLRAAAQAGIGKVGTHTMRHTYRSWLDAVGTPIAVQQKLMRHADIRTTMNTYGDVVTDEMARAHSKVVGLALNRAQTERKAS